MFMLNKISESESESNRILTITIGVLRSSNFRNNLHWLI